MPRDWRTERLKQRRTTITVTFDAPEVQTAETTALQRLGRNVRVDGFRPGNVPVDMLKQRVDPADLLEETVRGLIPTVMEHALREEKIVPLLPPRLEVITREPLTLSATFIERPEVTLKGADKIKIASTLVAVDDKDVQRVIDGLLQRHRTTKRVERAAQPGDEVTLDFSAKDAEGKPIAALTAEHYRSILGSQTLLPGFEEAMAGLSVGEEKTFPLTLPKNHPLTELQGKVVTFTAKVTSVAEVQLPALEDGFVQASFGLASIDDLRKEIRQTLEQQEQEADRARRESQLFAELRKAVKVDLAPELIEAEQRLLLRDLQQQLSQQGRTVEQWLSEANKTPEAFKTELETRAKERLELRFALEARIEELKIVITEDALNQAVSEILANAPEDQRTELAAFYAAGQEGHAQLEWQRKVETLVNGYLS
jgi:trigger factor